MNGRKNPLNPLFQRGKYRASHAFRAKWILFSLWQREVRRDFLFWRLAPKVNVLNGWNDLNANVLH
jgi:hypothetical protein